MELIVISSPQDIKDEVSLINELFAAGMRRFHLRKPNIGLAKLHKLVDNITPVYRHQVVLHQHHEIAVAFGLKRRHFPEALRRVQHESFTHLKKSGIALSTSIHKLSSLEDLNDFEYVFFGPVFNSISKFGYMSRLPANFHLPTRASPPAMIALGGIDHSNIQRVKAMNFDGIAILGAIWNKGDKPVTNFLSILECLNNDPETSIKTLKHD